MLTGPEIRRGELCSCSLANASSCGRVKSGERVGKSLARLVALCDGLSEEIDLRYLGAPLSIVLMKLPHDSLVYEKFFSTKLMFVDVAL